MTGGPSCPSLPSPLPSSSCLTLACFPPPLPPKPFPPADDPRDRWHRATTRKPPSAAALRPQSPPPTAWQHLPKHFGLPTTGNGTQEQAWKQTKVKPDREAPNGHLQLQVTGSTQQLLHLLRAPQGRDWSPPKGNKISFFLSVAREPAAAL